VPYFHSAGTEEVKAAKCGFYVIRLICNLHGKVSLMSASNLLDEDIERLLINA
jgi:hypothetical protein